MKIQKGFVSQKICDKTVLVRISTDDGFCGIVELNDTAVEIWHCLEKGYSPQKCAEMIIAKYDIDYESALASVNKIRNKMIENGIAAEE